MKNYQWQENINAYPVDPKIEPIKGKATVIMNGIVVAESIKAYRVLQKGIPPTVYFPPQDVKVELLRPDTHLKSNCPWKGDASYWDIEIGGELHKAVAWTYKEPLPDFEILTDYISFYPARVDQCILNGETVDKTISPFSGGWVTKDIVGYR